jgi:hypothetical protein
MLSERCPGGQQFRVVGHHPVHIEHRAETAPGGFEGGCPGGFIERSEAGRNRFTHEPTLADPEPVISKYTDAKHDLALD